MVLERSARAQGHDGDELVYRPGIININFVGITMCKGKIIGLNFSGIDDSLYKRYILFKPVYYIIYSSLSVPFLTWK